MESNPELLQTAQTLRISGRPYPHKTHYKTQASIRVLEVSPIRLRKDTLELSNSLQSTGTFYQTMNSVKSPEFSPQLRIQRVRKRNHSIIASDSTVSPSLPHASPTLLQNFATTYSEDKHLVTYFSPLALTFKLYPWYPTTAFPNSRSSLQYKKALQLFNEGKYAEAAKIWREAYKRRRCHVALACNFAISLHLSLRVFTNESYRVIREQALLHQGDAVILYNKAIMECQMGLFRECIDTIKVFAKSDGISLKMYNEINMNELYRAKAIALVGTGNYEKAMQLYNVQYDIMKNNNPGPCTITLPKVGNSSSKKGKSLNRKKPHLRQSPVLEQASPQILDIRNLLPAVDKTSEITSKKLEENLPTKDPSRTSTASVESYRSPLETQTETVFFIDAQKVIEQFETSAQADYEVLERALFHTKFFTYMHYVARIEILRTAQYITYKRSARIEPDNSIYLILKGYVITKYMKKGLVGMSTIRTKTKYEGEHFCFGSILVPDEKEEEGNIIREFYVFCGEFRGSRL